MKKTLTFLLLFIFFSKAYSQILSSNNFYTENMFFYNPSRAGEFERFSAILNYRNHLMSIENASTYGALGIHSPIYRKMSIGGMIKAERIGLFENTNGALAYSFRTNITENSKLSMGVNAGAVYRNFNSDNAVAFDLLDPMLSSDYYNEILFYYGAGLNYVNKNFEFDFSMPVLYRSGETFFTRLMGYTAYKFLFSDKKWHVKPSIAVTTVDFQKYLSHFNLALSFLETFWVQAGIKTTGSYVFTAGIYLKSFGLAYSYEMNNGPLGYIGGNSHGIMLSYGLNKKKEVLPDTVLQDSIFKKDELSRKVDGQSYEEYVRSNNAAFYSDMLNLTDSMHQEQVEQKKRDSIAHNDPELAEQAGRDSIMKAQKETARRDSVLKAQADRARRDSVIAARQDSIRQARVDSVKRAHALRNLNNDELKILEEGVHFHKGSAMLNDKSRKYLDKVVDLMNKNRSFRIQVSGHTCDIGSDDINMKYSRDRAEAVKYYLTSKGIPGNRISTSLKADAEPVVPNTSEQNREQNRRVSFSIIRE